ncbi:hypothetical protein KUCAC02_031468, partial [Chaenocephalus aceratus]
NQEPLSFSHYIPPGTVLKLKPPTCRLCSHVFADDQGPPEAQEPGRRCLFPGCAGPGPDPLNGKASSRE